MIFLKTPPGFDFHRTVTSHGWYRLPPFRYDALSRELHCVITDNMGRVVEVSMKPSAGRIMVRCGPASSRTIPPGSGIRQMLRSCLRLDEDFSGLYKVTEQYPEYRWIASTGSGRLLRSPTVFEDVVRLICTTNCSWALTTLMITNLVKLFGRPSGTGSRAFPEPAVIAGASESRLRREAKTGYRSPSLIRFSEEVASGKINPDEWRNSTLSDQALREQILRIRGVGPYAAENLLKLLGRYSFLGLDSWVRSRYFTVYHKGRKVGDSVIAKRFARWGDWQGLVFWLEMTRSWNLQKFTNGTDQATDGRVDQRRSSQPD